MECKSIKCSSSNGVYQYMTANKEMELGSHASLPNYYTHISGEAWGRGCERLRFTGEEKGHESHGG